MANEAVQSPLDQMSVEAGRKVGVFNKRPYNLTIKFAEGVLTIAQINQLMDEVTFARGGTEIRMRAK